MPILKSKLALCSLAAGIMFAAPMAVYAQSFAEMHGTSRATAIKSSGGVINSDGAIAAGSGFKSKRSSTGAYTITYAVGRFSTTPSFVCTANGLNPAVATCVIFSVSGNSDTGFVAHIHLYNTKGAAQDNGYSFSVNATS